MKRLFDGEEERWSEEAHEIHGEIHNALKPVFDRADIAGLSLIDISFVADAALKEIIYDARLAHSENASKKG